MQGQNRIIGAFFPAAVDHFLTAALHFRVAALHRSKIELFGAGATGHRRCGTATQANQHGRTAQHNNLRTGRDIQFLDMLSTDIAVTAGNHNRLVIAAYLGTGWSRHLLLESTEIAAQVGPAEFVVESGGAERCLDHDVQRGHDARRLAVVAFPGLNIIRNAQVGY